MKFEKVINFRDLSSGSSSSNDLVYLLPPSRIYRSGCISKASHNDVQALQQLLNIKTYIDLRSKTEIKNDSNINNAVFDGFTKQFFTSTMSQVQLNGHVTDKTNAKGICWFTPLISEFQIVLAIFLKMTILTKVSKR